jgi:hypothetical protein
MNLPNSAAGVNPAARRNQPCCIKIVKWFYPTLVERLESFPKRLRMGMMSKTGTSGRERRAALEIGNPEVDAGSKGNIDLQPSWDASALALQNGKGCDNIQISAG